MGFGASILLITVGAILRWGVTDNVDGLSLATIGLILLIVGAISLATSFVFWGSWGGFRSVRRGRTSDGRTYEERIETT